MKALTVHPRYAGSLSLAEVPEPAPTDHELLVESLFVGICGTDREIAAGHYGEAPEGSDWLILGHESLGRVRRAPVGSGFHEGQHVAAIVRRPDPEPCRSCGAGEWDMCENGRFTERGIKRLHGFGSELYSLEPAYAVAVPEALGASGVLLEPASVVAKAWEQIERLAGRSVFRPERVLVTGAGPIGLLAALMAQQRGYELHVLDRVERGPKPELVRALGATYHCGGFEALQGAVDIVVECTGAASVVVDSLSCTGPNGIVCLAGVSSGTRTVQLHASELNNELVMENGVVFGSVNANRRHFAAAAAALEQAPPGWLERIITRRVPLARYSEAFEARPGDIKTVLQFDSAISH
jgi:threonine dehydrogenase-like Zn-dependent dehydrogenase